MTNQTASVWGEVSRSLKPTSGTSRTGRMFWDRSGRVNGMSADVELLLYTVCEF